MKNLITLLFVLVSSITFSQKIDYDNFDEDLATKALAEAFLNFRDTFTHFTIDPKYKISDVNPDMNNYPELRKLKWSDYLYTNVSDKNCETLLSSSDFYHIDVKSWVESNVKVLTDDMFLGKNVPNVTYSLTGVTYLENLYRSVNLYFETYEDLAKDIIFSWNESPGHCSTLRIGSYSRSKLKKYNLKIPGIFSVCVKYNKETKKVISSLNIYDTE
jgi:hypothetical protein